MRAPEDEVTRLVRRALKNDALVNAQYPAVSDRLWELRADARPIILAKLSRRELPPKAVSRAFRCLVGLTRDEPTAMPDVFDVFYRLLQESIDEEDRTTRSVATNAVIHYASSIAFWASQSSDAQWSARLRSRVPPREVVRDWAVRALARGLNPYEDKMVRARLESGPA